METLRVVGGRYELTRPIGRGGMGEVWAAMDTRLDRTVAVKLLRPNALPAGVDQEVLIGRFSREARLTARLEHPGVPAVHDAGTDDGDLFLVMQLIEGADLGDFQAENEPVPIAWVAAVGAQIAAVLGAAHAAHLIHRDIKPRNIMITPNGQVKVLDFGLAALRDNESTRITRTAESLGTPAYMAPEQAMHGIATPASDLYALGCVLYELATGREVFTASTPLALMHRHYSEHPVPVAALRPDAGPALDSLISQLLAKPPQARPTSADEVYDRLVPLLGPCPTREIPMDPTRPFRNRVTIPHRPVPIDPPTLPRLPSPSTKDEPARRLLEGLLLGFAFLWLGIALILVPGNVSTGLVGVGTGIPLLWLGAWIRRRRLGNRHLWTVRSPFRKGPPPRPASVIERVVEVLLLILGLLGLASSAYDVAVTIAHRPDAKTPSTVLSSLLITLICLVSGAIMRRRRVG